MLGTFLLTIQIGALAQPDQPKEWLGLVGGKSVYMAWREHPNTSTPVVLALHGSGREAESYCPSSAKGVPFYVHQRDLALGCGYLFVAISNGRDTWGTDEGIKAVEALYEFVGQYETVEKKWVLWASSAGGVLMNRLIQKHPDRVFKALGTFPVYDVSVAFDQLASARMAWKDKAKAAQANPSRNPSALSHIPYLVFHGLTDQAVPAEIHSVRMRDEVNARGGQVRLQLVPGGHSTENFELYQDDIIRSFLCP